ncbi:MAG: type IX secretion system protein PorQ [Candidatus Azobacteroides sp.]|nr:type IX secretion system protein PorQ [Candidatus Azobacteroides sp.]
MRKLITLYLSLLCAFQLLAQEGKSGFDFLQLPTSVRAAALGGTNVSVVENDLSLVYQNPAFLGQEMDLSFSAGYLSYIADIKMGNIAFAKALGERSAWGIGVIYSNYGKMSETTEEKAILGDLNASDICGNLFFSRDLTERIRGGVTAKFIYSDYASNTAIGLGVDLGLSYYNSEKNLSLGLTGKNLGRQIKAYETELAGLPWEIQFGISQRLTHAPIRYSITAANLNRWQFYNLQGEKNAFVTNLLKHFVFGVEFLLSDNFWAGVGYNTRRAADLRLSDGNKLSGFSVGAGLRVKAFAFGCSVGKYHPSATSFMLNISTSLAEMKL